MCTLKTLQTLHKSEFTGSKKLLNLVKCATLTLGVLILFSWFSISLGKTHYISFSWILTLVCLLAYMPTHTRLAIATTALMSFGSIVAHFVAYPSPTQLSVLLCVALLAIGLGIYMLYSKKKQSFDIMIALKDISMIPILLCYELLRATNMLSHVGVGTAAKTTQKTGSKTEPNNETNGQS